MPKQSRFTEQEKQFLFSLETSENYNTTDVWDCLAEDRDIVSSLIDKGYLTLAINTASNSFGIKLTALGVEYFNELETKAERQRQAKQRYFKTEKGKQSQIRYRNSEKGKEVIAKYRESEKGQQAIQQYNQSEKRKLTNRWIQQEQRGKPSPTRSKEFRQVYGDPEVVLLKLDALERQIIELYCGLDEKPPMLAEHIAKLLNKPVEEVKTVKTRALKKLQ